MKPVYKRVLSWLTVLLLLATLAGCIPQEQAVPTTAPTQGSTAPQTIPSDPETVPPEIDPTLPQQTQPQETQPIQTDPVQTEPTQPVQTQPQEQERPSSTGLQVHFIDVGQADAALVLCDGAAMLIDGGNAPDSNLIFSYLKRLEIDYLDYIICTHAHEDHVGGLAGALNYAKVGVAYAPVTSYDSNAFRNFVKYLGNQGKSITVPTPGTGFALGGADCRILAVNTTSDTNNTSIVLRLTYGNTSFLFTGDAEREVEQWLCDSGQTLKSTVLKVGHHGSYTSSSYQFIRAVAPEYAVISVGKDNSYGHPHDQVLSRLRDADVELYRTDMHGDIICYSNGSSVTFLTAKNPSGDVMGGIGDNSTTRPTQPEQTEPTQPTETQPVGESYVLNTNSMKFHETTCRYAQSISESNRLDYTGTREEVIEKGYAPCKVCNP